MLYSLEIKNCLSVRYKKKQQHWKFTKKNISKNILSSFGTYWIIKPTISTNLASRFLFICMMLSHFQTNWFLSSWFLKHWVFWLFSKLSDSDMHLRFVSTSQRFLFYTESRFVPVQFGKRNPINISPCVSKWVCQIQNQMFALGYHLSAKSLLWFIQMMQETQFSPQLSIMIE